MWAKRFLLPGLLFGFIAFYLGRGFFLKHEASDFNVNLFSRLPVLEGGRIKPLDSLARNSLLVISGKQALRHEGRKISADQWLLDVMLKPETADQYEAFEIDDPDVRGILGIPPGTKRRFAYALIYPHLGEIEKQAHHADQIQSPDRNRYQRSILDLFQKVSLYQRLQNTLQLAGEQDVFREVKDSQVELSALLQEHAKSGQAFAGTQVQRFFNRAQMIMQSAFFYPIPMGNDEKGELAWVSVGEALLHAVSRGHSPEMVFNYAQMADAYRAGNSVVFNQSLQRISNELSQYFPEYSRKSSLEFRFNEFSPFIRSMTLYVLILIMAPIAWMLAHQKLQHMAFKILVIAFVVHTFGLVGRMWLQGRPPVTNLYSSAIFVGWAAVLLSVILERVFRNGIGNFVGSLIGFSTLIVAHHLATQGDTMEMMRAVLDSNFWLATHVVTITIGYSSTYLSGFIAVVYLIRRIFDRQWGPQSAEGLASMVFGVVCFSTFFSFLGTVLGGIWADQSWGRFWGWDPKENGALLIVLWNTMILHIWWGRLAQQKTIMMLTVFGNVITTFSWFGVNMLGIGLHSYGFMDKAFIWLVLFSLSQIALMLTGLVKPRPTSTSSSR